MEDTNLKVISQLKVAQNHLKKAIKFFTANKSGYEVVHESQKAQLILRSVDKILLENYLKKCFAKLAKAEQKDFYIQEISKLYKYVH